MSRIVEAILGLSGLAAYSLVGLLAFGEAAAFVGLVLPGELAVLLGGVVASSGQASLPVMIVVASVAAVAGDSVGYELGRRIGPRVLAWPRFHDRFGELVEKSQTYLQERGGRAVFFGRWTSVLRALVPGLAGMARMPYRQFLVYNVAGGVVWATTFVTIGYLAGSSWRQVERVAGQASLLLLVVVIVIVGMRLLTRRLVARADDVRVGLTSVAQRPAITWFMTRFRRPLQFLRDRVTPGAALGLGWTLSILLVGAAAWVVGIAVQDLFAREELALLDRPVATWITSHVTPASASTAEVVVDAFGAPIGLWVVAGASVVAHRFEGWIAARRVLLASVFAVLLTYGLRAVLPITAAGTQFPAAAVTLLTTTIVAVLPAVARTNFVASIRTAGVGVALVIVVGLAELVSGEAALSGVVGAMAIGVLLGLGGEVTQRAIVWQSRPDAVVA